MENIGGIILIIGIVLAIVWRTNAKEKNKQETLKLLLEKGHDLQNPEITKLLENKPAPMESNPGDTYRGFMIGGVLCMFVGVGLAVMFGIIGYLERDHGALVAGLGIGSLLLIIGAGLLTCTRFVSKPPGNDRD